ncbi:O-antigen ligase family protein [Methylophilaceae bacterium Uisw_099_01]
MTSKLKFFFPYFLPLLLIFSRSLADITIVLVSVSFLYYSYKHIGWEWIKEKWFFLALIFSAYCMTINSALSINPTESLAYSIFFIRWPIFAMALSYWILNDIKSLKKFLVSMTIVLIFIIFDTWWQFFFELDIFGFEKFRPDRLTGPFKGNPQVGVWVSKLVLLLPLFLILYNKMKLQDHRNYLTYVFFIISTLLFLSILISGERMALLMMISSIFILFVGLALDKIFSFKKIFILLLLSFSGILIFAYLFPDPTQYAFVSTIEKILNWRSSDYSLVWQSAYDVWMQSPFFGAGLHKYREACENLGTYGTYYLDSAGSGVCFHPHNITLQLLSETGVIGFVLFYLMVIFLAISSLRTYVTKKLWLNFAIVFSIIFTCFLPIQSGTSFFANKYGAIIWLLVGVMLATNKLFNKGKFLNKK